MPTTSATGGVEFYDAIAQGSPERDFGERMPTPSTCSTPAATTDSQGDVAARGHSSGPVGAPDFATGEEAMHDEQ